MTGSPGLRRFVGRAGAGGAYPGADQPAPAGPPHGAGGRAQRAGRSAAGQPGERCGLCAKPIAAEHGHIADLEQSALVCSCRPCYLLFAGDSGSGRYRAVPDRYLADPAHPLSVAEWDELDIPVGLAFFTRSTQRDEISGFYPSPAGVTESVLGLRTWRRLAETHPLLRAAEPDVEAILVCRTGPGVEYFLVPVDACYELAGRMRLHWRGFDGGTEARASIEEFLADVRERALPVPADVPEELRIEPNRRRYTDAEASRLEDLFGQPSRWADTLKPMQLATVPVMVPGFRGATEVELPIMCGYDLEIASTKYFNALDSGETPLLLLFSGTVFASREHRLSVQQVPWSKEASYRLPASVWRAAVDVHFPNSAYITMSRQTLDALQQFKSRRALPTWDSAVSALLAEAAERQP